MVVYLSYSNIYGNNPNLGGIKILVYLSILTLEYVNVAHLIFQLMLNIIMGGSQKRNLVFKVKILLILRNDLSKVIWTFFHQKYMSLSTIVRFLPLLLIITVNFDISNSKYSLFSSKLFLCVYKLPNLSVNAWRFLSVVVFPFRNGLWLFKNYIPLILYCHNIVGLPISIPCVTIYK